MPPVVEIGVVVALTASSLPCTCLCGSGGIGSMILIRRLRGTLDPEASFFMLVVHFFSDWSLALAATVSEEF